jgi:Pyruvate/2-oxoacid:ferredoxin oxidoreductase delta subunit
MIVFSKSTDADPATLSWETAILAHCREQGMACRVIPPLYHIAESSKLWKRLAESLDDSVLLGWFHPRPAHWLLQRHQITIEESQIFDLRRFGDVSAVFAALHAAVNAGSSAALRSEVVGRDDGKGEPVPCPASDVVEMLRAPTRPRWYPVVDGSRCIQCRHCLQFCLFGVYELDTEGKVRVRYPDQCKPGCPACSRICPQSAIMFPLYEKDSAIAGSPGEFVVLDAAARKMFYTRTQQPCPVCGQTVDRKKKAAGGALCAECGLPLPKDRVSAGKETEPDDTTKGEGDASSKKTAFDDLDSLVDELDRSMRRRN